MVVVVGMECGDFYVVVVFIYVDGVEFDFGILYCIGLWLYDFLYLFGMGVGGEV